MKIKLFLGYNTLLMEYDKHIKYKYKYFLNHIYNITIIFFYVFNKNDSVIKDEMNVDQIYF